MPDDRQERLPDSDRISRMMDAERRDILAAIDRCRTEEQRKTIYLGNINRLVGQRERLYDDLERLWQWATNYYQSDPNVVAMLEEIEEALGEH